VHLSMRTISPAAKERARPVNLDYIDAYAVYSPITKEVYYVAKKHLTGRKSGMQLRIVESKIRDSRIHYAKNVKNIKDLFWKCG
jgi:hypothetical protein